MRKTPVRFTSAAGVATLALAGVIAAAPAAFAEVDPQVAAAEDVVINEIESDGSDDVLDGADWVELHNPGDVDARMDGYVLQDNDDSHRYTLPTDTLVPAGGYLVLTRYDDEFGTGDFDYGLGGDDAVSLLRADSSVLDSFGWAEHAEGTYSRCPASPIGFDDRPATPGAANDCAAAEPAAALVINEVSSDTPDDTLDGADWIELHNTSSVALDVNGVLVADGDPDHVYVIDGHEPIPAGGYLVLTRFDDGSGIGDFDYGLGRGDSVRLFPADTVLTGEGELPGDAVALDQTSWPSEDHAAPSWGRCADGSGDFRMLVSATPGAANDCSTSGEGGEGGDGGEEPLELSTTLTINEVESNGDDTDWVEIANLTDAAIDISGYTFRDNDDEREPYELPTGSVVPANGLFVIEEATTSSPGFDFGLGDPDSARLYDGEGTLVAKYSWDAHAGVTWARCPDPAGDFSDSVKGTKGAPNDCVPIRINEIESSDAADGDDWVELINVGTEPWDLQGLTLTDENLPGTTIESSLVVPAGGFVVLNDGVEFDFGLGGSDSVRLFDGEALVDSYTWDGHAATTYGRCPDGSGEFTTTAQPTPGESNECAGLVDAQAWPGGADVTVLDEADWFDGDISGIDYEPSGTDAPGVLWAVHNGDGLLYKLVADAEAGWVLAPGWEDGRKLRFPEGTGTVDAEGVTVRDGEPGVVYVSSERDNDGSGSRASILRYEVGGTGELVATHEWRVGDALGSLPANGGAEGITWVPDSVLVDAGFMVGGAELYNPAEFHGKVPGAFIVGVESTGKAYVYVVHATSDEFAALAEIDMTGVSFPMVADVQWDGVNEQLWVVCDEACDGRIATFGLVDGAFAATALYERPAGMGNFANEGFAIGDATVCVDGALPTFYVDDADTDGFSLRSGTLPGDCGDDAGETPGETPGDGDGDGDGSGEGDGDGSDSGDGDGSGSGDGDGDGDGETAECEVVGPPNGTAGSDVTVFLDPTCAPDMVRVVVYSEPTDLGLYAVAANGSVTFTLPEDLPAGEHTVEVQAEDGTVLGTSAITVTAATPADTGTDADGTDTTNTEGELAATGAEGASALTWAALLVLVGAGLLVGRRRA